MRKPIALLTLILGMAFAAIAPATAADRSGGRSAAPPSGRHGGAAPPSRGGGYYRPSGHSHSDSHWTFGLTFGGPLWYGPGYYPYRYYYPYAYPYPYPYYYPPAVVMPSEPRVYIERDDQATADAQTSPYWYYCRESDTYYPYVKECAGQWERVPARPQ